ncbi:MAG: J domain-containing protein [Elusimicrobia bacterium]|nr:J domain-containing protein [Elusimicrobiota bacterium]
MDYKDYYKILGVSKNSSQDEIKKAYRQLARKYHPDMHPEAKKAEMSEKFKDINEAYEVLSDPQKKATYDQLGPDWQQGPRPDPRQRQYSSRGPAQGFRFTQGGGQGFENLSGFSDFFQSIFGSAGFAGGRGGGGFSFGEDMDQMQQPHRMEAELRLSLEDAFQGGQKQLDLPSSYPCERCGGTGRAGRSVCPQCSGTGASTGHKTVKVNFPKGIADGATLRLKGQAGDGQDLYLNIKLLPHPQFRLTGKDLETELPLMPWDAVLGAQTQVQTLDGSVKIKIPPGTPAGRKLKIAGHGYYGKNGQRGDLYATVDIAIPQRLSQEQLELFRKLKQTAQ